MADEVLTGDGDPGHNPCNDNDAVGEMQCRNYNHMKAVQVGLPDLPQEAPSFVEVVSEAAKQAVKQLNQQIFSEETEAPSCNLGSKLSELDKAACVGGAHKSLNVSVSF